MANSDSGFLGRGSQPRRCGFVADEHLAAGLCELVDRPGLRRLPDGQCAHQPDDLGKSRNLLHRPGRGPARRRLHRPLPGRRPPRGERGHTAPLLGRLLAPGALLSATLYSRYGQGDPSWVDEAGLVIITALMLVTGLIWQLKAPT